MRLYDEIFKTTDGATCARCILLPGGGGYFEGVKYVEDFSSERIVVCFPRQKIELEGEALSIAKYCDGDLAIGGKILTVRTLGGRKEEKKTERGDI